MLVFGSVEFKSSTPRNSRSTYRHSSQPVVGDVSQFRFYRLNVGFDVHIFICLYMIYYIHIRTYIYIHKKNIYICIHIYIYINIPMRVYYI